MFESIIFGSSKHPETSDGALSKQETSPCDTEGISCNIVEDHDEMIDLIKNKRARRARVLPDGGDETIRVPERRYISTTEFESRLKTQHNSGDWIAKLKKEKAEGRGQASAFADKRLGVVKHDSNLTMRSCGSLTGSRPHESTVRAVGILTSGAAMTVAFSAGADKTLRFYHFNENKKETSSIVKIAKTPIWAAVPDHDSTNIYFSSDHSMLYSFNVETQKAVLLSRLHAKNESTRINKVCQFDRCLYALDAAGLIYQLDTRQTGIVRKYNSGTHCTDFVINPNSGEIVAGDQSGDLYTWSPSTTRCVRREHIDGSLGISSLGFTRDGLIIGDRGGIVAIHNIEDVKKPIKSFDNLSGAPRSMFTNPELPLCLVSNMDAANNCKLFNTQQRFTYQNFPPRTLNLSRLTAACLGGDGWILCGNERGHVRIIKHCVT